MTKTLIMTSLLLLLGVGAASADDAALERLRKLEGFDAARVRTTYLGFYMGGRRVGAFKTQTAKSEREDAVYVETNTISMKFGPTDNEEVVTVYLAADLSMVAETKVSTERKTEKNEAGEETTTEAVTRTTLERAGDTWVRTVVAPDGTESILKAPVKGPNYSSSLMAVTSFLAGTPGEYTLPGITWKGESKQVELKLSVAAAAEVEHRGQKVSGVAVKASGKGDAPINLLLTPKGELLGLSPEGAPVRFVAGTKEECAKDLPGAKALGAAEGSGDPMAAVKVYFYVLAGAQPVEDLDKVLDYTAIHAFMAKEDPDVQAMTPAMVADLLKSQFKKVIPALPQDQADMVLAMMEAKIEGDTATAAIPGKEESPFLLRKTEGGKWVITSFPH